LITSAEVLEFESLRQLLGRYLASAPGRRELDKLQPHDGRARLEADLAEAAEAVEYLRLAARPPNRCSPPPPNASRDSAGARKPSAIFAPS
jgi:dsDNA-specific endonuclease/ATPase MutS2